MKLDRIDIVLIHDPDDHHQEALDGAFKTLDALRADGTVGAVGVGMNWSEPLARFAREADFDIFLLAGRYTLLEQDSMDELLPAVDEKGMSIIAGGVYNSGVMADPDTQPRYNYADAPADIVEKARAIKEVCDERRRAAALPRRRSSRSRTRPSRRSRSARGRRTSSTTTCRCWHSKFPTICGTT